MSKLGFNLVISKMKRLERQFLSDGMKLARQEFKFNFDSQSDAESNMLWHPVKRKVPPKILVNTGNMKSEAIRTGKITTLPGKMILTIDPIDIRGNGYASFHQDGEGRIQRNYVTQSENLTNKQTNRLLDLLDKAF